MLLPDMASTGRSKHAGEVKKSNIWLSMMVHSKLQVRELVVSAVVTGIPDILVQSLFVHILWTFLFIYLFQYFSVQQAVLFCCHDKVMGVILESEFDSDRVNLK